MLDRSGSMQAARSDTIDGFNAFLAEQVDDGEVALQELYRSLARNVNMRSSRSKADMRWEVQDRDIQREQGAAGHSGGTGSGA